ncbi:hypothetical protein Tco_1118159 [Tanacetum coccineum]
MHVVGGNNENQFRQYARQNTRNQFGYNADQIEGNQNGYNTTQNVRNQVVHNAVQNPGIQNGNQTGLIVVPRIANPNANQNRNSNVVTARAGGNVNGNNGNQIWCYNYRGMGIQLQAEEYDLMAASGDIDEIEEVNANCILMANLQQASTSGTQTDKAPVYHSDGSAKNKNNVTSVDSSMEQSGGTVNQHPATVEETCAHYESLFNNLAVEVEKVNAVNQKHDPPAVYDSKETLQLAQESRLKMKQMNREIKPANYAKINKLSEVFVFQKAKSREEVYFSNTSKTTTVSNTISIPNDEFSDDTPSVARKFLNEVKDTLVMLQHVVKHIMNGNITKFSSSTHQEIHNIFKDKIVPIVNKVDARVQNFKKHFMKEAAKFVQDFKYHAMKAGNSLDKIKVLECEIERLLRAVVSQDIMSIVQNNSVVDTSYLQTELDRMKEKMENCIIKKENEYAKLWNDWIYPTMNSRVDNFVLDKHVKASGVDNTKTRRTQPRSNTKNDRAPSSSKSSCIKNKDVEVEEHHMNLLLSKNKKHMSSECNNIKLAIQNDKYEVVYAMWIKAMVILLNPSS